MGTIPRAPPFSLWFNNKRSSFCFDLLVGDIFCCSPQQKNKKQVGDVKNHATRLPVWLLLYLNQNTHQKTNIVPENGSSQKEFHLPTIHFQGQFVSFREGNFGETIIQLPPGKDRWLATPMYPPFVSCAFYFHYLEVERILRIRG